MSSHLPWSWVEQTTAHKIPLAWQKLEPHSRNADFSEGVQARIYDPLWMLARQWQLGEFEGEDSGSPVKVKLENRQAKISNLIDNNGNIFAYNDSIPLEVFVERTKLEVTTSTKDGNMQNELDLQIRVRLGLQFKREVETLLKEILDYQAARVFVRFLAKDPDLRFELNDKQYEFEIEITKKYLSIIRGRVIDIYRIMNLPATSILRDKAIQYFTDNPSSVPNLPILVGDALETAFNNLMEWWHGNMTAADPPKQEEPFFEVVPDNFSLWEPKHLEYSFKLQVIPEDTSHKLILDASEYKEDHLDWHSFIISESTEGLELPILPDNGANQFLIPTNLKFSGMPNKRWWDFEDGHVNFGSLEPKKNNLTTILPMEYALVHSSDWYVIPQQIKVGTINKIENFIVIDCFGQESIIEPAGRTSSEVALAESDRTWNTWGMFTISEKYKERDQQHYTPYFLLPPTLDYTLTGNPLEEIKILRDETANLVWAVEKTYRTAAMSIISIFMEN